MSKNKFVKYLLLEIKKNLVAKFTLPLRLKRNQLTVDRPARDLVFQELEAIKSKLEKLTQELGTLRNVRNSYFHHFS